MSFFYYLISSNEINVIAGTICTVFVGHARVIRHVRTIMDVHRDNVSYMGINLPICARDRRQKLGRDTIGIAR